MKFIITTKLVILSAAALLFGRSPGFCTANAAPSESAPPDFQKQLNDQAAQIANLQSQLAAKPAAEENLGTLGLHCKGAGVDIQDVRWRIEKGLSPEQAVEVAISQKAETARRAEEAKAAKDKK